MYSPLLLFHGFTWFPPEGGHIRGVWGGSYEDRCQYTNLPLYIYQYIPIYTHISIFHISTNQSISQSINHSISQSINQSVNPSIKQSVKKGQPLLFLFLFSFFASFVSFSSSSPAPPLTLLLLFIAATAATMTIITIMPIMTIMICMVIISSSQFPSPSPSLAPS